MSRIKKGPVVITLCILILVFIVVCDNCQAESFRARTSRVIDGDSLVVKRGKEKIRIRLWGIDTPEKGQPFSQEAKRFTQRLLLGRMVTVTSVEYDDYGRLVAMVYLGRDNVSEKLVGSGLAWVHIYYCHKRICNTWKVLERKAREAKRGLWLEKHPVPPWQWKREVLKIRQ